MTTQTNDERLTLSVPEAARLLGISRQSGYEAATRGEIPTIKIGHRVLVPRAQLEKLLAGAGGSKAAA
jgi:excisionase family DNA binding protein